MDRLIYTSMSGAKATMQRQDTLANNLANVSTVGFRAELQAFRAVPVQGSGASTRVFALESTPGFDATPGSVTATGRNLDVAMKGNAWLAVQGLDGTEAYTKAGSLDISTDGTLVTSGGLTVLGDGGPIQVPANSEINIAQDGTVSAKTPPPIHTAALPAKASPTSASGKSVPEKATKAAITTPTRPSPTIMPEASSTPSCLVDSGRAVRAACRS